ncbi:MAG: hypothetical protein DRJ35_03275 [Thermoprotei archaeon]|nr:MAG: hypothetical protein DRJ35_03275 [Thermoprotei archaeon]
MTHRFPFPIYNNRIYGVANSQLIPELMAELGAALGTLLGEGSLVVAARDLYPPSRMLKRSFSAGLMSTGISVIDFHGATLPELSFAVKRFGAKAGIHFSVAPHRDDSIQIKILDSNGMEISFDKLNDLLMLYETKHIVRTIPSRIGWVSYAEYIHEIYTASVASFLDVPPISALRPQIAVDVNFGPATDVLPILLSEIGVRFILLNSHKPSSRHPPRQLPSLESMEMLSKIVEASGSLFAAALSSDASQVFFIDDHGRIIDSDKIIGVFVMTLPRGAKIAISESTSILVDKIAETQKVTILRVKGVVGDVSRAVRRLKANLGATDSGEFIFPQFSFSSDGILSIGKLLETLAIEDVRLSTIIDTLPEVPTFRLEIDMDENRFRPVIDYTYSRHPEIVFTPTHIKYKVEDTWIKLSFDKEKSKLIIETEDVSKTGREIVKRVADEIEELGKSFI